MLTPDDLIQSYEGRAGLLARCILYGLVEPQVEITSAVQATLAQTLIDELQASSKTEFLRRIDKALKWAVREDVSPELAIFTIEQTIPLRSKTLQRGIHKTAEYQAYREKLGDLFDAATF